MAQDPIRTSLGNILTPDAPHSNQMEGIPAGQPMEKISSEDNGGGGTTTRPVLYRSVREALANESAATKASGGYVIQRRHLTAVQSHDEEIETQELEAPDAAGYTVIRRRTVSGGDAEETKKWKHAVTRNHHRGAATRDRKEKSPQQHQQKAQSSSGWWRRHTKSHSGNQKPTMTSSNTSNVNPIVTKAARAFEMVHQQQKFKQMEHQEERLESTMQHLKLEDSWMSASATSIAPLHHDMHESGAINDNTQNQWPNPEKEEEQKSDDDGLGWQSMWPTPVKNPNMPSSMEEKLGKWMGWESPLQQDPKI